ncbi:gluconate 2-dehydrogenase subunit 3 family protein [Hymenobacter artigasi]|uniref:Outer membrane protein beta-barrel domain-containing protein n=1 Tax=Hymenobacter artigasi TaxID=2719616 RepID=A0ABX1HIY0_9BACT|nr:gluconate 2-dehydrogenase subunit 3 family protein [Hymenobacter artigasi]NKI90226.1 hypothetical protein [Hymenobacter artigasi]
MLQRLLLLLAFALSYTFQTQAQAFEPGLLVRANGDTLRGEIENSFWKEPPAVIRFRATPGSLVQVLKPRQLRAVLFTNGRYFRYEALPVNHAAEVQLDRLPRGYTIDVHTDSLLADVLLEGAAEMLRVELNGIIHYLVRRHGQPFLDLSEQKYLRETVAGTQAITDGNNYQNTLGVYFGDCPAAQAAAAKAPFTAPGIAVVVQAYNTGCAPSQQPGRSWLVQSKVRRRVSVQGGILLGMRYNRVASPRDMDGYEVLDQRPRPTAELFAEMFLPGRTTSIYGELSLSTFRSRQGLYSYRSGITVGGVKAYEFAYADYSAWLGSARIGLRKYSSLKHNQQLVLGVSYELNSIFNPAFSTITTGSSGNPTETAPAAPAFNTRVGFTAQTLLPALTLGWRVNRLTLTVDAQRSYDFRDKNNAVESLFLGSAWSARLMVTYQLGRNPDAVRPSAAR